MQVMVSQNYRDSLDSVFLRNLFNLSDSFFEASSTFLETVLQPEIKIMVKQNLTLIKLLKPNEQEIQNKKKDLDIIFDFIFIVLTSLVLPLHPLAIFVFVNISAIWSTIGHLGYEIFPRSFTKSIFGKYLNLATVHNQHHKLFLYNFGYYTTIWDRIFGTLHPDTDKLIKIKSSSNY